MNDPSPACTQCQVSCFGAWMGLVGLFAIGWVTVLACANAREILGLPPHAPLAPLDAVGLAALVVAPPALVAGFLYDRLTRGTSNRAARRIFRTESAGSFLGGTLVATPLWERPGIPGVMFVVALIAVIVEAVARRHRDAQVDVPPASGAVLQAHRSGPGGDGPRQDRGGQDSTSHPIRQALHLLKCIARRGAILALVGLVILGTASFLDRPLARRVPGGTMLERRELRAGSAAILSGQGQMDLWVGGRFVAAWPARQEREGLMALAMLQQSHPDRVLVWGGRAAILAHPAVALGAREVTVLADDQGMIDMQRGRFAGLDAELRAPGVRIVIQELRSFLADTPGTFDVILLDSPVPSTALANRVFTREGLALARGALAPGGILALPLSSASTGGTLPPRYRQRNFVLVATLKTVFAAVEAAPGDEEVLLVRADGGPTPDRRGLCLAASTLARRLDRLPALGYLTGDQLDDLIPPFPTRRLNATYAKVASAPLNTDARPLACVLTCTAEASTGESGNTWTHIGLIAAGLALLVVAIRAARRGTGRVANTSTHRTLLALGLISMVAMTGQLLLLMVFQTALGALYQGLGLLVGVGLAGVAAGACIPPVSARASHSRGRLRGVALGASAASLVIALVAADPSRVAARVPLQPVILGLALWMGSLSGRAYAQALEEGGGGSERGGGDEAGAGEDGFPARAYAADMLGGCLASGLAAGFFMPLFGFAWTGCGAALVAICAALVAPWHRREHVP